MVQPFHANFLAGAFPHGLLDVIAGLIGEQAIYPYQALILGLIAELGLAVDGPAHEPAGILYRYDAAGDYATAEGIAFADTLNIRDDAVIQGGHGGAHPVGLFGIEAEFVGMAKGGVLDRDAPPHIPAAAFLDFRAKIGGHILAAHGGVLNAAAIGDENKIVIRQHDEILLVVAQHFDGSGVLAAIRFDVKFHIDHFRAVMELHIMAFQVTHHGQDHGFILIILGKAQGLEIGQAADMVNEAFNVQLHFQGAVPVFKGEHGAPV